MRNKTIFKILKMDCPSEEQLVRFKLSSLEGVELLEFNLPERELIVYHKNDSSEILSKLNELSLSARIKDSEIHSGNLMDSKNDESEKNVLWQVLGINFFFFILELMFGYFSKSMGLVADSLDMLADSIVYALALFVVGRSFILKKKIAKLAGYFQFLLAVLGLMEVVRRFFSLEEIPSYQIMISISVLALMGNSMSLYLLEKNQSKGIHMEASRIFTSYDVKVNIAVILAGVLVYVTNSKLPDLLIGAIIFFIVVRGAIMTLKLAV
jgi:Co/Zn/Cd efflux system component